MGQSHKIFPLFQETATKFKIWKIIEMPTKKFIFRLLTKEHVHS